MVKALRYKSVGPGIESKRWRLEFILCQQTFPCALGSTQPLKMRGKGGRCVRVTTLPPSCAECLEICSLKRPEPSGPHRPVIGVALRFYRIILNISKLSWFQDFSLNRKHIKQMKIPAVGRLCSSMWGKADGEYLILQNPEAATASENDNA